MSHCFETLTLRYNKVVMKYVWIMHYELNEVVHPLAPTICSRSAIVSLHGIVMQFLSSSYSESCFLGRAFC